MEHDATDEESAANKVGLHKKPHMEELVNYLANSQERTRFPDRETKFIRNHPFMTQPDFVKMQDEQQKAWEEQTRKEEAKQIAEERTSPQPR